LFEAFTVISRYDANIPFSIQSCRSCYATQHLCQRSFYKIFVKFRNSKKNVLKIVLIIININKDQNKSLISNQFSLKNDCFPHFLENYFAEVKIKKLKTITNHFASPRPRKIYVLGTEMTTYSSF
jgi:hypothetical protein